ncbi:MULTISPECIES: hypothetical protein [Paenibacillus]|uniref:Cell division protein FtsL n=1 Tax=Paenibacillus vini TaxID=1476024 RepID=A0ABQ4M6W4_9BACL|nr:MULTISPECIES: hypothetical protein [Paenibacillus]MBQ4897497.1 hypothetical protein [Paenibacillus sp. Marseille-P2973]MDN4070175.1 hypothetical protein [Paenibacillus vini]GIP51736.1 hypothetical protein J42TS3_07710 [Paenibacillus vini]
MAYTRGNLAVKEQTVERGQQSPRFRETTKVVTRRSPLPVREKLLYMVTVLFCVAVMGGLLWQNSNLYNIKRQMYNLDTEIQAMTVQIKEMSVQKEKLQEQIPQEAAKLGYVETSEEGFHIQIPANSQTEGSADEVTTAKK